MGFWFLVFVRIKKRSFGLVRIFLVGIGGGLGVYGRKRRGGGLFFCNLLVDNSVEVSWIGFCFRSGCVWLESLGWGLFIVWLVSVVGVIFFSFGVWFCRFVWVLWVGGFFFYFEWGSFSGCLLFGYNY